MFLEAEDILTLLIFLTWEVVRTPWDFANPLFREFFTSAETIAAIAGLSTFEFQHDLFDVLNAGSPPSLEWFKTIPDIPPTAGTPICGIYFLILEKNGETPLLSVGSGTSASGGLRDRLQQHRDKANMPSLVAKAYDNGFHQTHFGVPVSCPLPQAEYVPYLRILFIVLEAVFTWVF